MRIIDFEAHFYSEELLQAMAGRQDYPIFDANARKVQYTRDNGLPIRPILVADDEKSIDQRLREMDECGIEQEVISVCAGLEELPIEQQRVLAPKINDLAYSVCQKHPDRFRAYASLPVLDIEASMREIERCISELGFFAWGSFSNFGANGYIDEPRFYPLLEKCAWLGAPVYLHPAEPHTERYAGFGKFLCSNALGGAHDSMTAFMRMMLSGVFDKLPDLQMMLGHFGEGLAFFIERIDNVVAKSPEAANYCKKTPSAYFRENVLLTTSGYFSVGGVQCVKTVCGLDRVLFGTDYPMEHVMRNQVDFIQGLSVVTEEEKEKIFSKNAERLLGF